jgi:hypothetical protein
MRKVRLDLDQLQVDSFDTQPAGPGWGTVRANIEGDGGDYEAIVTPPTKPSLDCCPISAGCPVSLGLTCPATCPRTCPDTCGILCTAGCTEAWSECLFTGDPVCCV